MTRIDRRALFSSGAAAALLAASGVSLAAAPRVGGRMRLALPRENNILSRLVRGAAYNTLTEMAPNGVLKGDLAAGWRGSEDARVWDIDLRNDVVFHNGHPLQSFDVVESLRGHDALGRIQIRAVVSTGPQSLRLELADGNPDLPILLSDPGLIICAGGRVDLPLREAIGTGCYHTERLDEERHYLGQKAANHFKDERSGWVDSVEAVVIPDASVRSDALIDGFVDIAVLPMPDNLHSQSDLIFLPSAEDMALVTHGNVGVPQVIGSLDLLDDGRLAERWWMR